jgi:hypothetical protein
MAEAAGLSELREFSGVGTRQRASLLRRLGRGAVDETLPLPGLPCRAHAAALQPLAGFLGAMAGDGGVPSGKAARAVLRHLLANRIILSTHSLKYCEVRRLEHPPNRILAVAPALEAG